MPETIFKIAIFFFTGVGMAGVPVALTFLLWRNTSKTAKSHKLKAISLQEEPYESGMPPVGSGRVVGFEYFIYAVLFLLFDVIAILLFLGVVVLREGRHAHPWPFLMLCGLALMIIAYGIRSRNYLKI